jgi:hypothetical protein
MRFPPKSANAPRAPEFSERRTTMRYGCNMGQLARLYVKVTGEQSCGWIHDVSATGIAFDTLVPFDPGTDLMFELRDIGPTDHFAAHVQVMHSTAHEGLYRVGCKLEEPLPVAWLNAILGRLADG